MILKRGLRVLKKLAVLSAENSITVTLRYIICRIRGDTEPMEVKFLGRSLWLRPGSPDMEIAYSSLSGEFAPLQEVVAPDSRGLIIDAGGYIGTAALALSDLFPNADVLTIEPSDENFSVLRRNISANEKISAIHGALVPEDHAGPLNLIDRGGGYWGFTLGSDNENGQVKCTAEPIMLSTLLQISQVKQVLILKMDIEGSERALLLKGKDWLPETNVLFVELHPEIFADLIDIYYNACTDRQNFEPIKEKYLSMRCG